MMITTLPTIKDVCKPRDEILKGDLTQDIFAANLSLVVQGKGPEVYRNPDLFFSNTFPTAGLRTSVKEVFTRLSNGEGTPVIKLETGLGGGKTHTLIALYHLAKNGSSIAGTEGILEGLSFGPVRVAAVVGTELPVSKEHQETNTLWGEIVRQLFGDEGFKKIKASDRERISPGNRLLEEVFSDEKCVILIDELAIYLARTSGVTFGKTTLAENTVTFLQEFSEFASSHDNVALVITSLDPKGVFAERTKEVEDVLKTAVQEEAAKRMVGDADKVISRVVQSLQPTRGEEFPHIIRYRLFDSIDEGVRDRVCLAYHHGYQEESTRDHLTTAVLDPRYLDTMKKTYPFHPSLIEILRSKTSSIENFNQTRGVLRLLSRLLKHVWDADEAPAMVHPYHIDFNDEKMMEELIFRLDKAEYAPAITEDLANTDKDTRAEMVDKKYKQPFGTWITTTIMLHNLTGLGGTEIVKGATEPEVFISLYSPGTDLEAVGKALEALDDVWFFFGKEGPYYVCGLSPRMNKIIEEAKEAVAKTKVQEEAQRRIESTFGAKKYFKSILFANQPVAVPDDTDRPKLVVLHYNDCMTAPKAPGGVPSEVQSIYNEAGSVRQPRIYINNLLFLVADKDNVKAMFTKAREYLALKKLLGDSEKGASYLASLTKDQKDKLKAQWEESELYLKIAVILAYKHLFVPTAQADLLQLEEKRPLRQLTMRDTERDVEPHVRSRTSAEDVIVEFLRNNLAAKTNDDKPVSPDFVLDNVWPKNVASLTGDDFKKQFYKRAKAGLHLSEELIRKSMQDGVKEGKWYAVDGDRFFDREHALSFQARFTADVSLVLAQSDKGREIKNQFTCPKCGMLKTECTCGKDGGDVVPPKKCPRCHRPLNKCVCGKETIFNSGSKYKAERLAKDLSSWFSDQKTTGIKRATFVAGGRNALSALTMALPQLGKADVTFDVTGTIDRESQDGGFMRVVYRGDTKGFQVVKPALMNFQPAEEFDQHELEVTIAFEPPTDAAQFIQGLAEKVAPFTQDNLYQLEVEPVKEGDA